MAIKTQKTNTKSKLWVQDIKEPVELKEHYQTIKRRILSEGEFVEVTLADGNEKRLFAKTYINTIAPAV